MSAIKLENMIKDERSLLLYFETAAVDYGGLIDGRRMNEIDFDLAKEWNERGFVLFGRIYSDHIRTTGGNRFDHWVVLSEDAWVEAHKERRNRNGRVQSQLTVYRNGYDDD